MYRITFIISILTEHLLYIRDTLNIHMLSHLLPSPPSVGYITTILPSVFVRALNLREVIHWWLQNRGEAEPERELAVFNTTALGHTSGTRGIPHTCMIVTTGGPELSEPGGIWPHIREWSAPGHTPPPGGCDSIKERSPYSQIIVESFSLGIAFENIEHYFFGIS